MIETLLSVAVIAAFALVWGGWRLRAHDRRKARLMWIAAAVIAANVAILTV